MEILHALESIRSPFLDTFFGLVTRLGEQTFLIVVFCALYWCINKRIAYVMGLVFFVSALAVQGLKIIFRVPRPWVASPGFEPVGYSTDAATGYSFPSGHTQNGAALMGTLGAQIKKRAISITLFVLVLLVGFSRMYLGVHYMSDVLVSLGITFVLIGVGPYIIAPEANNIKRELIVSLCVIAFAVVVIAISSFRYFGYFGEASEPALIRDATRAAAAAIAFAIGLFVERVYIKFSVKTRNIGFQILKFVIGLGVTLGLQEGLRIMGTGLIPDALRYFIVVLWIAVIYPLIIKKFFSVEE